MKTETWKPYCCKVCGSTDMKITHGFILGDEGDCLKCGAWQDDAGFWWERVDGKLKKMPGQGESFGLKF